MSRPIEPQKKEELLEKCSIVAIEAGTLNFSIHEIAKKIGSSGRMLVYHFGSKQELERQIIGRLEIRLRERFWSLQNSTSADKERKLDSLMALWEHLTSPEMYRPLQLTMELNQRAIRGDVETQLFLERESLIWLDMLEKIVEDRAIAVSLLHLFQGAILDFLTTKNEARGKESIRVLLALIAKNK